MAADVAVEVRPWWESRLCLALVVLATMIPLVYPPIPPLVDLFGHMGRYRVELDLAHSPWLQAYYDYHWAAIGNLGVDILYGHGISWEGTVLDAALERKIVQKSGSYFSFEDERLGQGRQNATAFLREHPDVTQDILRAIQLQLGEGAIVSSRLLPTAENGSAPTAEADAAEADADGEEAEAESERATAGAKASGR